MLLLSVSSIERRQAFGFRFPNDPDGTDGKP
jgi:hypothetical protein